MGRRVSRPMPKPTARTKILDAALRVIRERGYSATTVDDIVAEAGVAKGSFFNQFGSKEGMAVAAAEYWSEMTGALFEAAPYHDEQTPAERVLAYIAFRRDIIRGTLPEFTCLVGTMVQESYETNPAIRDACWDCIRSHAGTLVEDIEQAIAECGVDVDWTAESLALHTQAVIQGAFILAKASDDPGHAIASVDHLYRYVDMLFAARPTSH